MNKQWLITCLCLLLLSSKGLAFEPPRMHPTDRFMLVLFTDIWQDEPGEMDLRSLQRGVSIKAMQDMPLGRTNFSVAAGLGFTSHNLYSDHRYLYNPAWDHFDFYPITTDYDKNKLSLNYLEVPVEFRFRTRDINRRFRLYTGLKAGYLVNAHTKYEGKSDHDQDHAGGRRVKLKEHRLDNIASYRIGLTAMLGYRSVNIHLYYPLTNVFEDNSAEEMNAISLGVTLILF